jgi:predicted nucleic acid-binding protein
VRLALDTNVLVYAEGLNGAEKKRVALDLFEKLPEETFVIPAQVLGELFNVLVRKAGQSPRQAHTTLLRWHDAFPIVETSPAVILAAAGLAADHRLGIWDAVVLSASAAADCRLLLTEDLQDGFTWGGLTVANPFSPRPNELLAALFDNGATP